MSRHFFRFIENRVPLLGTVLILAFLFGFGPYFAGPNGNANRTHAAELSEIDADQPPAAAAPAVQHQPTAEKAPDGEGPPQARNYLVWMMVSLGWFFAPIFLVMSIVMVALVVMNMLAIRREVLRPSLLVEQFEGLLKEKKYQEAYELAKENDSFLGKVLSAGLAKMSSGYEQAVQAMQDVGEEETIQLEQRIGYLALLGNIAPMLGLFGTVVGMIDSFQTIAVSVGTPPAYKLAEGIATALFTTEVGLAIAIPSIAFYDIFRNYLNRYVLEISILSDNLMSRFKK